MLARDRERTRRLLHVRVHVPVLKEALEAAIIRDPDDLDAFAVYGDWLAEQGDPRGELVATQLAAERDPSLEREALRVFARHRDYFIGQLGSMIATNAFTCALASSPRVSFDRLLIEDGARVARTRRVVATCSRTTRVLVELTIRPDR